MIGVSISIDVPDLKQAELFYSQALGCTNPRTEGPNIVVLTCAAVDLYLLKRDAGSQAVANDNTMSRNYARHWTPVHLDFGVSDLSDSIEKVVQAGGTHEGTDDDEWGNIAYCADPFGNGFCLIESQSSD